MKRPIDRPALVVATAATLVCAMTFPAFSQALEAYRATALSSDELSRLQCPPVHAVGPFADPMTAKPSPEVALWVSYDGSDDIVRLIGGETEAFIDLGHGNDVAFVYEAETAVDLTGSAGNDSLYLCSMSELVASINPGYISVDADRDVIVIASPVFTSVPARMLREISIQNFEEHTDRLVIHAPQAFLDTKQASRDIGGFRIGDVIVKVFPPPQGAEPLDYDEDAFIFVAE